jgi:hypothetical protein
VDNPVLSVIAAHPPIVERGLAERIVGRDIADARPERHEPSRPEDDARRRRQDLERSVASDEPPRQSER